MKKIRKSEIARKTAETDIRLSLKLDGTGKYSIDTTMPFMDHMLQQFSKHSGIDLNIKATGDTMIDCHHLTEDLGIALGAALGKALDTKKGIERYGFFLLPMDEALCYAAVDFSGRPYLEFQAKFKKYVDFDYSLIEEFFRAVANTARMTIHIKQYAGKNNHHIAESIFKGFARAVKQAVKFNKKESGIPSTKEIL